MEKNLEKSLKRFLKRKVKITTAFIVAFLLGSLATYGDIFVQYDKQNEKIKFFKDGNIITDSEELKKLGKVTGNPKDGFTWTINGEIPEQGQGQIIVDNIKDISFNIINNGKIINSSLSGNGIYNFNSATESIVNNGTISGSSNSGDKSGNGILNLVSTMGNIKNNGIISGNSSSGDYSGKSIGNLQNITGDGNTSVILTNNISDKNVSDINGNTGNKDENYDFVKNLSNISDIYLAKGHNYVDVNKIVEINPNIYTDKYWNINSENNSEANYFKVSLKNLYENKISLYGSNSTEDTIEITDKFENNIFYIQSISGIEKLVLSEEGNNVLIDSQLVTTSGLNEIIGKDGGKDGNTFTINDIQPEDKILGMKIEGGTSSNDTLKIDTENITLSNTYDTLEKILINKTGIENLVLGNADNNINFTYTDKDKNLSDFKNITSGNGNDKFIVSVDNIGNMKIDGGENAADGDALTILGALDNDTQGKENKTDTGENLAVNIGDIDFGNKKGTLEIEDTSKIEKIGTITNGDISVGAADTEGFNKILISSNNGVENISVKEKTELEIKNDYNGKLSFEKGNNTITLKSNEQETFKDYSGNIVFEKGGNNLTVAENTNVEGKISVNGETNNITVNGTANALTFEQNSNKNSVAVNGKLSGLGFTENSSENTITINGTLESGIDFGENSYGNILTISENGSVGKDIKFGTGIGNEFKLSSKNGIFNYNIKNADIINLSGTKGEWNFAGGKITGNNVAVNINDNGIIGFNIGKSNTGLVLGKNGTNPFAETGNYIVNGDIKVTFDDTVKFTSLSDTLKATGSNISLGKNYNIIVPEFMKYDSSKKEFAIKSAEELKSAGLKDYAFGNYEHAILNYNKEGYGSLTTLLNNNSLTQISAVLNKGIDEKDYSSILMTER